MPPSTVASATPLNVSASHAPFQWYNLSVNASANGTENPGGRWRASLAYDPVDNYVVLFGGHNPRWTSVNYTWTYANGTWTNRTSFAAPHPSARTGAGFAYDPVSGMMILWGGLNATGYANDTWYFHDGTWVDYKVVHAPPRMTGLVMSTDSSDREILVYGRAWDENGPEANQTWLFENFEWVNITSTSGAQPPNVNDAQATNDPADHGVLLTGGFNWNGRPTNATWLFHAGTWENVTPVSQSPPPVAGGSLVYLAGNSSVVLAVGYSPEQGNVENNYTWVWDHDAWTNVTSIVGNGPYTRDGVAYCNYENGSALVYGGEDHFLGYERNIGGLWYLNTTLSISGNVHPVSAYLPLIAYFSGNASGGLQPPLQHGWTFGDGTSTSAWSGVKTYSTAGTYPVVFWVRNGGDYVHQSFNVTAIALPSVTLKANATRTTVGGSIVLWANATGGEGGFTFNWLFGDNTSTSGTTNQVTHRYLSQSNGTVYVAVMDVNGRWAHATVSVSVYLVPVAPLAVTASVNASATTVGGVLVFRAVASGGAGGYTYLWLFGDNTTGSGAEIAHQFFSQGNGTVWVVANDTAGHFTHTSLSVAVHRIPSSVSSTSTSGVSTGLLELAGAAVVVVAIAAVGAWMVLRSKRRAPPQGAPTTPASPAPPPEPSPPAPLPPPPGD